MFSFSTSLRGIQLLFFNNMTEAQRTTCTIQSDVWFGLYCVIRRLYAHSSGSPSWTDHRNVFPFVPDLLITSLVMAVLSSLAIDLISFILIGCVGSSDGVQKGCRFIKCVWGLLVDALPCACTLVSLLFWERFSVCLGMHMMIQL